MTSHADRVRPAFLAPDDQAASVFRVSAGVPRVGAAATMVCLPADVQPVERLAVLAVAFSEGAVAMGCLCVYASYAVRLASPGVACCAGIVAAEFPNMRACTLRRPRYRVIRKRYGYKFPVPQSPSRRTPCRPYLRMQHKHGCYPLLAVYDMLAGGSFDGDLESDAHPVTGLLTDVDTSVDAQ